MKRHSIDTTLRIPQDRVFSNTLHSRFLEHFSHYDYDAWIPPKERRDWITRWVSDGEYIDIGCGARPVTMDIADGKNRGVGVDISSQAARVSKRYFKDFYLFDIENIQPR